MKAKRRKLRITIRDYLIAQRKASREEEITKHGKQIMFRPHIHKSKKQYNRQTRKHATVTEDDGMFYLSAYQR